MAGKAVWPTEILGNIGNALFIALSFLVIFTERALEKNVWLNGGKTVAGAEDKHHVGISLDNQIIQTSIDKVDAGTSAPVTKQTALNVVKGEFVF